MNMDSRTENWTLFSFFSLSMIIAVVKSGGETRAPAQERPIPVKSAEASRPIVSSTPLIMPTKPATAEVVQVDTRKPVPPAFLQKGASKNVVKKKAAKKETTKSRVQDPPSAFQKVFSEYPWDLPHTAESRELQKKSPVDFDDSAFQNLGSNDYRAWTAAESQRDVESAEQAIMKAVSESLDELEKTHEAPRVEKVKLVPYPRNSRMILENDGILILPVTSYLNKARIRTFLELSNVLQEASAKRFSGIYVVPEAFGELTYEPTRESLDRILNEFSEGIYSKVAKPLVANQKLFKSVSVLQANDSKPAWDFVARENRLKANLTTFKELKDPVATTTGYLHAIAAVPETLRNRMNVDFSPPAYEGEIRSASDPRVFRPKTMFSYEAVNAFSAAVSAKSSKILEKLAQGEKIGSINMVVCPLGSFGNSQQGCGGLHNNQIEVPVGGERFPAHALSPTFFDAVTVEKALGEILGVK
jgi:hypothetical protein